MKGPYLTTIRLNKRYTGRGFLDAQHAHTLVFDMIGERGLWGQPEPGVLVIQHTQPVNWFDYRKVATSSHTTSITTPKKGATIRYALIGNPTGRKTLKHGQTSSRRYPLPPEKWNLWLERHLNQAISITRADTTRLPPAIGRFHQRNTTHHRVMFLGEGVVNSQDCLKSLQHGGVGQGKAYGCGLLIISQGEL